MAIESVSKQKVDEYLKELLRTKYIMKKGERTRYSFWKHVYKFCHISPPIFAFEQFQTIKIRFQCNLQYIIFDAIFNFLWTRILLVVLKLITFMKKVSHCWNPVALFVKSLPNWRMIRMTVENLIRSDFDVKTFLRKFMLSNFLSENWKWLLSCTFKGDKIKKK